VGSEVGHGVGAVGASVPATVCAMYCSNSECGSPRWTDNGDASVPATVCAMYCCRVGLAATLADVGASVAATLAAVGASVAATLAAVGTAVAATLEAEGASVGAAEGASVGVPVGASVGASVGAAEGASVGTAVGASVATSAGFDIGCMDAAASRAEGGVGGGEGAAIGSVCLPAPRQNFLVATLCTGVEQSRHCLSLFHSRALTSCSAVEQTVAGAQTRSESTDGAVTSHSVNMLQVELAGALVGATFWGRLRW
jgi:hypothetical protein